MFDGVNIPVGPIDQSLLGQQDAAAPQVPSQDRLIRNYHPDLAEELKDESRPPDEESNQLLDEEMDPESEDQEEM